MRYRALDADGDMQFGQSQNDFLINSPAAVAQAVLTRLRLIQGEWYLDNTEGTPWSTEILGVRTRPTYDRALRDRISGTQGVKSILEYSSNLDGRRLTVQARIDTIYGEAVISEVL
jgi:hypothetical protein